MRQDEFLHQEHDGIAEWVNGDVFVMSVTNEHQRVVGFLNQLIGVYAGMFGLGVVRSVRYPMRLATSTSVREPDLMFVLTTHRERITSDLLDGPADLVVEVVSEESIVRDYDEKFIEYQSGGVREYWIVDPRPNRLRVSFFVLGADGRYRPVALDEQGVYHSTVLTNFWLDPNWLWQTEGEPDSLAALAKIAGADAVVAALRSK